jgi:hypothetical protein
MYPIHEKECLEAFQGISSCFETNFHISKHFGTENLQGRKIPATFLIT